jgi:hypothetical protein
MLNTQVSGLKQVAIASNPHSPHASSVTIIDSQSVPAANSILDEYTPTTFAQNVTLSSGIYDTAYLEIQYPNSMLVQYPANETQVDNIVYLSTILALNSTGQFGYRFNDNDGNVTSWTPFTVQNGTSDPSSDPSLSETDIINAVVTVCLITVVSSFAFGTVIFYFIGFRRGQSKAESKSFNSIKRPPRDGESNRGVGIKHGR